jgi:hypothetical protein
MAASGTTAGIGGAGAIAAGDGESPGVFGGYYAGYYGGACGYGYRWTYRWGCVPVYGYGFGYY